MDEPDPVGRLIQLAGRAARKPGVDLLRRMLLGSAVAALASRYVSVAYAAQHRPFQDFMLVSTTLTGHHDLSPVLGGRIHAALRADNSQFETDIRALIMLLAQMDGSTHKMEGAPVRLAQLAEAIMAGWYTGIVGAGNHARCLSYETSLMNIAVEDKLKPPSFCYGGYGSWVNKPV